MSTSLQLNGLWLTRLLRPWDSPGKSPGWVAVPFSRGFSWPRNWTWVSRIVGRLFTIWATREAPCSSKLGHKCGIGLVSKPCLTLCDPTDCSPLGSSVHGILQARTLEWPFPSPGDLPDPGIESAFPTFQEDSLPLNHQESPDHKCYPLVTFFLLIVSFPSLDNVWFYDSKKNNRDSNKTVTNTFINIQFVTPIWQIFSHAKTQKAVLFLPI